MLPVKRLIVELLRSRQMWIRPILSSSSLGSYKIIYETQRGKNNDSKRDITSLFQPVPITSNSDDINVGAEISGDLTKADLQKILVKFCQRKEIHDLAKESGIGDDVRLQAFNSFRRYCIESETLPTDLHVAISDILKGAGHITDIFPYFIRHAKEIFPHIDCLDELKQISDLRNPANWYPSARTKKRKIIFHAGPTNSGKTYHALERFRNAKSGIYCGPLKLLAVEVYQKTNKLGTPCDLVTGEERLYANDDNSPSNHIACTVEMAGLINSYEIAILDEIQMIKDVTRGWAWTRALLGINADEIHLCGETGAADLLHAICSTTGEEVEVREYKRLTPLEIESSALESLKNIRPGDCIVCFNKADIYAISRELESAGVEVAVIYGSLPPNTKLSQAAKFNDPKKECQVMIATDAIGMGLNLHIRRIIFKSLMKPVINEKGEKEIDVISVSSALQIAGRAGRYGTQWEKGYVTTFKSADLPILQKILKQTPEPIMQAGLHPTADQIELYAYHLPKAALSNLMDIFVSLCTYDDSLYFICNIDDFKFLADMIQHVPLPLRARYVFCCAPITRKLLLPCSMFLKFARQYSKNEVITFQWLCQQVDWPFQQPKRIGDLVHLEAVFDVFDLYLWLSYRFGDLFPHVQAVMDAQQELDELIQEGIRQLTKLLQNTETGVSDEVSPSNENRVEASTEIQPNAENRHLGQGKLSSRLLSQGLLTPSMLQELQQEWMKQRPKMNVSTYGYKHTPRSRKPK